ncbi:SGNH hydrolase-type esterase domain-containing protein [Lentinula raphanica]|nr:SGNH hydrolase-type esterase domain-containing protein [Lentinula raphanica]
MFKAQCLLVVAGLIRLSLAWNATFLPLGDSITYGWLSTDGNGYREDLLELITAGGDSVDYIGSIQAGTMADNWNDGYIGCTIDQIASSGVPALEMVPQVVLLMAGTNDIDYQEDLTNAPSRLMTLVDEIFSYSPDAAIIVSDIPLIVDDELEPLVMTYNSGVQELVQERISEGQHLVHVSLSSLTSSEMADELHPNDEGYQVLAQAWYVGVQTASSAGWIS